MKVLLRKPAFLFPFILAFLLCTLAKAGPIVFPPTYHLLEKDTYQTAFQSLQQGDTVALQSLIDRDPIVARKVLIKLLRQPDKLEMARTMAEIFPESCEGELEKPLFDFFLGATPETRKKLLDQVELLTDSQITWAKRDYSDRFSRRANEQALVNVHQSAGEFHAMDFVDGEAYSLKTWAILRIKIPCAEDIDSTLETLEKARSLYEKSSNSRGQSLCLVQLAMVNNLALQKKDKASQLFLLACEKGKMDRTPILGYFLSQYSWLAEKTHVDWLNESKTALENQPGLRRTRYRMLLDRMYLDKEAGAKKYRAMLDKETDPLLKIRAHYEWFLSLAGQNRHAEALGEADAAITLARLQNYDMTAYGGHMFDPAVPSMLLTRSGSKAQLGMFREAEDDILEAQRLLEQGTSDTDVNCTELMRINALENLQWIFRTLGEYPLAIEKAREALKFSQQRQDFDDSELRALASLYAEMGQLRIAEEYLETAAGGQSYLTSFNPALIDLAQLHLDFQLYEEALRDLDRAQEGLEHWGNNCILARRNNYWITLHLRLLTEVWLRLGQPEKALQTATAVEEWNYQIPQGMLGVALMALGRYAEAEKYFQARLESLKGTTYPQKEVDAVLNLGKICQAQKRSGEASSYYQSALGLYRQMGDRRGELEVLLEIGQMAYKLNDLRTSEQNSLQALALATELHYPQGVWSAEYRLAKTALSRGKKQKAIEHLEASVDAVEDVSAKIKVDVYKTGFLEDKVQVYDELIALLGPIDPAKAFYYAEKRRARAFLESSQRAGHVTTTIPDDLRFRKEAMEARLVGKQKALLEQFSKPASQRNLALIQSFQNDLKQIRKEHTQLINTIELDKSTGKVARKEIYPLTASQVQQKVLRPGQALLEYLVRDRETYLFLLTSKACNFYLLPITQQELARRIEKLQLPFSQFQEGRIDLAHLSYDVQLSHGLYRLLFQPIEPALRPGTEIIVIPDDVLNYLPFESLSRTGELRPATAELPFAEYRDVDWLVKRFTFVYALSASSLRLRLEEPDSAQRQLLAFGNPSVGSSQKSDIARVVLRGSLKTGEHFPEFPSLPQAVKESKKIGELMSGKFRTKVFLGDQATESQFFKEAPSADYLHFAVHSMVNQEEPFYSALVLAPEQHSDGLLQAYEIVNTRLQSHLVTLSGCETALGKLKRGEGMLGLQRAFLQAGAESVVVSLWSVEDSTADFMEVFYRNIRGGQCFSVALRNAKLKYLDGTFALGSGQKLSLSHPFFWAPFVLTTTALDSR